MKKTIRRFLSLTLCLLLICPGAASAKNGEVESSELGIDYVFPAELLLDYGMYGTVRKTSPDDTEPPNLKWQQQKYPIPLTDQDDPNTPEDETLTYAEGDPVGSSWIYAETENTCQGEILKYLEVLVEKQWKLRLKTTEIKIYETEAESSGSLDFVHSDAEPSASNHLLWVPSSKTDFSPDAVYPAASPGWRYVYVGSENVSQYWATYLFLTKNPDYPEEEPVYTDENGTHYYLRQGHNVNKRYFVEGLYLNGELAEPRDKTYPAFYSSVYQFTIRDSLSGKFITAYCADLNTPAEEGFSYSMQNIDDVSYYEQEQADMIRTIAVNGYWGSDSGMGSLDSMRDMMRSARDEEGQPIFSEEEVLSLTDGVAMTATQYAIWKYSNVMSQQEFVNAHFTTKDGDFNLLSSLQNVNGETDQAALDLLFKLYDYLCSLDPSVIETSTPQNTIINVNNFVENMSLTIKEKDTAHPANKDDDESNDVYIADFNMLLAVEATEGNGDDLLITLYSDEGHPIAKGRLAGELQDGEVRLTKNAQEEYCFEGIPIAEGEQSIRITITGVQNLEQGVYLFKSEAREGLSSQTMLGIAEGERPVNVSMRFSFELDIQDELLSWNFYSDTPPAPPTPPVLLKIPQTGSFMGSWILFPSLAILLLGLKKRLSENDV